MELPARKGIQRKNADCSRAFNVDFLASAGYVNKIEDGFHLRFSKITKRFAGWEKVRIISKLKDGCERLCFAIFFCRDRIDKPRGTMLA